MSSFKAVTLFLFALVAALHAQQPALPFTSGTFNTAGLMSLRHSPPFRAKITEKKGTAGNFTLALEQTNGTRQTFTVIGGGEGERKMFEHFKPGAQYDFPKVFEDVLGNEPPVPASQTSVTTSTYPVSAIPAANPGFTFPPEKLDLLDLNHCKPFRAKILGKTISPDLISLTLACTDGRTPTLQHSGNARMDEALKIAKPLEKGRFYEFPMSVLPPYQDEPAPPTPAMKALELFVGEWEVTSLDKPEQQIRARYHWKLDGTGLWRESTVKDGHSDDYRMANAILITYDSATGHYVETMTRSTSLPPLERTWDAAARTLSGVNYITHPDGERKLTTITTFKTDDLIEWKTTITTREGKFIEEHQGRYIRIKP